MNNNLAAAIAAIALATALPGGLALAQVPAANADAMTDPSMKRAEVVAFIGVKPGDKVADIVAGRFVRALSAAVGPNGKLYAVMPAEVVKAHPEVVPMLKAGESAPGSNIVVSTPPVNAMGLAANSLDAVFIRQNYHDLYDKFMGPADVAGFNKQVYAALKPGGVYVILDHAAAAGAPINVTETLHRIDIAQVKADVLAAGFKLDGESNAFVNPADDHTKMVFAPDVRGKTDQFMLRFRKPE
ncbi:MAG: methyltransferase [Alphaproteobacteria bacterium]|nr:methyltransferase [Alphaproteobacteria bacterium]MBU1514042.1 methyltransferase [Alphaproteobacteria bacterium]MBU2093018.1 methyltransferase [Alphaproteobacteria bacterium]MBU2151779.1 methyltransferase [Alphaproteobacteria bacterium]MBU2309401.1 methyltransferase [Alphaproteobacteria bacterium]